MTLNYTVRQINSPFDDTAFFARNIYKKHPVLFDCGRLGKITNAELLSISDIFISHTHIDHFYGFDRIIRGSICAEKTVRVFGPPGIIKNVQGKIDAYTWNLIRSYPLQIQVIELHPSGNCKQAHFSAFKGFIPDYSDIVFDQIEFEDGFTLDVEFFDHGITSVGYRLNEPQQVHIDKDKLADNNYKPGKWLGELTIALTTGADKTSHIEVETHEDVKQISIKQLETEIVIYKQPQSITFMTDMGPTYANVQKAIQFAKNSTILLIESVFLKNEILHAMEKNHMTLELSKFIFNESKSQYVKFFHFAPRYEYQKEHFFSVLYDGTQGKILPNPK